MARATLITAYEVVRYSPAGKDYPTDKICQLIPDIEEKFGYECLGETLYDWLLANRATYPQSVTEWTCDRSYDIGEYVIRFGCLFESAVDLNTVDPADDDDEESWVVAQRFGDNDCANEFWGDYLRRVLALKVYAASINTTTRKAGPNGLVMLEGGGSFGNQGFRSGSKAELSDYREDLLDMTETAVKNMERWMKKRILETSSDCELPLSSTPACMNAICAPDNQQRRRWGFKY